ncbi:mitochondrial import receptor subunit TOM6 homolog [Carettochelys insculpta]|uniref:mitochondrial import receptor subunit TOM6 homolog n=1 Tax=Carettochelys insculpta TaxID=44489 RepID=UPI003EBB89EF
MAPGGQAVGGGGGSSSSGNSSSRSPGSPRPRLRDWVRSALRFAADRNDFRRNLIVNLGLFAAGVWVARNLTDFDLMSPQPVA